MFVLGVQGFKALRCTRIILAGIEVMRMSKKGQVDCPKAQASSWKSWSGEVLSALSCGAVDGSG